MDLINLENLKTKKNLIRDFFTWLFDDPRFVRKDVVLDNEIDLALVSTYEDPHIYYPQQIADFFNTVPMQRLGKISQLGLVINQYPSAYHNRLEHSKGVYYRKLEEMLCNFQNQLWKKQIEDSRMKLHLFAELIKVAGHDLGHFPLSHAVEVTVGHRGMHELIGKRLLLEDSQILTVLKSISPYLPAILEEVCNNPVLNFKEHDESNNDVDRLDFNIRDPLYTGNLVYIPYIHYEAVPNDDGTSIDVYDYDSLHHIENFLKIRENNYKEIYFGSKTYVAERSIEIFFKVFFSTDSQIGNDLREFFSNLRNSSISNMSLASFLKWDDLSFYSEVLDIAANHEDDNIRDLATMIIPILDSFLTMIYSHLNMNAKNRNYTPEEKSFIQNIKSLIGSSNSLYQNLKNPDFVEDNTLVFQDINPIPYEIENLKEKGFIHTSQITIKAYDPKDPIYVRGKDGEIYELSQHPDRECDWNTRIYTKPITYAIVPYLRFYGLSEERIDELRKFCQTLPKKDKPCEVNMQPLQVGHDIEDYFLEI